jgi:hypothetical protein
VIDKSNDIVVDETPIEEVINQNNQRYEEEQSETFTSDSSVAVASTDSLYLTFISRDTSWVKIIIDDVNSREVIIYPKHKITFTASKDFKATVGNSGVVSLQLNNKSIEFTGSTGSVRHFKLDKSGLIYLNTPPKLEQ